MSTNKNRETSIMPKEIIGYLGPDGSFSQGVCATLYPPTIDRKFQQFANLIDLINAVSQKQVTHIVIPVRNSISGILSDKNNKELLSYLIEDEHLYILNEYSLILEFCLLVHQTAQIHEIKVVHTNPYAKKICAPYFLKHPEWIIEEHSSSSEAAKIAAEKQSREHAAFSAPAAAKIYQLNILTDVIFTEEEKPPIMHFLVLSAQNKLPELIQSSPSSVSIFIVTMPLEKNIISAKENIEILFLHHFPDTNHFYIEVAGQYTEEEFSQILEAEKVRKCGQYLIDLEKKRVIERLFR